MSKRPTKLRGPGANYSVTVIGAESASPLRDLYHAFLLRSWLFAFGVITVAFLAMNTLFALAYLATGGIAHARPGSFLDAFFFSVQTMGTVGYGALYPESTAANTLVVAQSIVGLALTALATGLVFAKFARSTARLVFTHEATISNVDGVPVLSFRVGNRRSNQIVDARITLSMVRTEKTADGGNFYRMRDLKLTRDRALSLSRSWTVQHRIDQDSPLFGCTQESLEADEVELQILVLGIDDTSMQQVHAGHRYFTHQIAFQKRHVDILSEGEDGALTLDLNKFHDLVDVD